MRRGLFCAAAILVLDQASKAWLIALLADAGRPLEVFPFFNLIMVWNRGVSFGLFGTGGDLQRWILFALALIAAGLVAVWLARVSSGMMQLALGAIIGGAVGNGIDRAFRGAVADFFDFYLYNYHWPAFNIADSAIVVGAAVVLFDGLFAAGEHSKLR